MWSHVRTFVIISIGHFADNQSVRCCALSKHWHNGFKKSVFCFPHLAVPIGSATTLSDDEPKRGPIAYQLLRARIMLVPDFDFDILSTYVFASSSRRKHDRVVLINVKIGVIQSLLFKFKNDVF